MKCKLVMDQLWDINVRFVGIHLKNMTLNTLVVVNIVCRCVLIANMQKLNALVN